MLISRDTAIYEHALASTACLLSGLEVFNVGYSHQDRVKRVLKGLHGFHIYASQYWTDYVLYICSSGDSHHQLFDLTTTLRNLSNALEVLGGLSISSKGTGELTVSGNRLDLLKEYPGLQINAKIALQARSQMTLGGVSGEEGRYILQSSTDPIQKVNLQQLLESLCVDLSPIRDLQDALTNYQKTIRSILSLSDFPEISEEDLERFKREYRTTIFACRLFCCPRGTTGFESETLRLEHEATHALRLNCSFPGCQYPPFVSARALRSHELKCHGPTQRRKTIRKVDPINNRKLVLGSNSDICKSDSDSGTKTGMIKESMGEDTTLPTYCDTTFNLDFSTLENPAVLENFYWDGWDLPPTVDIDMMMLFDPGMAAGVFARQVSMELNADRYPEPNSYLPYI